MRKQLLCVFPLYFLPQTRLPIPGAISGFQETHFLDISSLRQTLVQISKLRLIMDERNLSQYPRPMDTLCTRCDGMMARGQSSWYARPSTHLSLAWSAGMHRSFPLDDSSGMKSVPFRVGMVGLSGSEDRTISRYPFQDNTCAIRLAATTVIALTRAPARDAFRADPSLCSPPSRWSFVRRVSVSLDKISGRYYDSSALSSATRAFGFLRSFTLSFRAIVSIDSTMRDAHVCASGRIKFPERICLPHALI
jgi:hypothetical protein